MCSYVDLKLNQTAYQTLTFITKYKMKYIVLALHFLLIQFEAKHNPIKFCNFSSKDCITQI